MNKENLKGELERARLEDEKSSSKNKNYNVEWVIAIRAINTLSVVVNRQILVEMIENTSRQASVDGDDFAVSRLLAALDEMGGKLFLVNVDSYSEEQVKAIGRTYGLFGLQESNRWVRLIADPIIKSDTMNNYINYIIEKGLNDETYAQAEKAIVAAKRTAGATV